jgi:hypothetical protein
LFSDFTRVSFWRMWRWVEKFWRLNLHNMQE